MIIFVDMKDRLLRCLGKIIPVFLLLILLPISVIVTPFVWLFKKIKRYVIHPKNRS